MNDTKGPQYRSIQLYNDLRSEVERIIEQLLMPLAREPRNDIHFPCDLYLDGDAVVIEVEMPGLEKGQIRIEGIDKFIEISGEKDTVKKKYRECVALERANGRFKKLLYIERSVNMHHATAKLADGVLTIRLPLIEEKRGKKLIPID